jgi:hypothetical protein
MSYCRKGPGSDVYVYPAKNDTIVCCGCILNDNEDVKFDNRRDVLTHLAKHTREGHKVLESVFGRLAREIKNEPK